MATDIVTGELRYENGVRRCSCGGFPKRDWSWNENDEQVPTWKCDNCWRHHPRRETKRGREMTASQRKVVERIYAAVDRAKHYRREHVEYKQLDYGTTSLTIRPGIWFASMHFMIGRNGGVVLYHDKPVRVRGGDLQRKHVQDTGREAWQWFEVHLNI
jgi:hypothetical protein